jgi:glutathione peroxidase
MNTIDKAKLTSKGTTQMEVSSLYDIEINSLEGNVISLSKFKGKKILFVNVASKCGFTKQYKELQTLSDTYPNSLVVIGLPCNQFGGQEPGTAVEIQNFCSLNYDVKFQLTEKVKVKGSDQHKIYNWLTSKKLNGKKSSSVKWNFQKYLVDEQGQLIDYYYSITSPTSSKITKHL